MSLSKRATATLLLLINVVCWGAALPLVKPALEHTSPFQHLFMRYVLACILTAPFLIWYLYKKPQLAKKIPTIGSLEIIGTLTALGFVYEGLARTTAINAGIIITAAPVFVILAGVIFLREKQEKNEWIGLFIALFGTMLLTFSSGWQQEMSFSNGVFLGNTFLVLQNLAEAGYFILAKKKYAAMPKLFVTGISFWIGLVGFFVLGMLKQQLGPLAFLTDTWSDFQHPAVMMASAYMAIFGSIIGLTAYIAGQNLIEASEATVFRYLQPLIYIPLSVFYLKESFTPITLMALVLIGLGVLLAEYRKKVQKRARR